MQTPQTPLDLGPLEALLQDPAVQEILIDGPTRIYVDRNGRLEDATQHFEDAAHLLRVLRTIHGLGGQRLDADTPIADSRLPDGTRICSVIPPIAGQAPASVIRKLSHKYLQLTLDDLVERDALNNEMATFLQNCVRGGITILIAGGAGSGKTTFFNSLATLIPDEERIIVVQSDDELMVQRPRLVTLNAPAPGPDGSRNPSMQELLRTALRMRPERIILSELGGGETLDLLQAINNGHNGSMASIHATSPTDAIVRLEMLATQANPALPLLHIRHQIASAFQLVIQLERRFDGVRHVTRISEVGVLEHGTIQLHDIFRNDGEGFQITGHMPTFLTRLAQRNIDVDPGRFQAEG